jgi:NAD(P)-dependent dehydrogenase (short-subunit alcohol dehydrogenase family)
VTSKVCVVTGASSGIGKEIARELGAAGANLVLVSRNPEKIAAAVKEIRATATGPVSTALADFASLAEVRRLAAELRERCPRIDVLVNNAGWYKLRRTTTMDGHEAVFGVNHLAPFLLTNLLLPTLKESAPARIVMVASGAHFGRSLDFADLQSERGYRAMNVYGRSKLANIMFTYALARRLEGSGVTVNCLHPGWVATNLGSGNSIPMKPVTFFSRLFGAITPSKGADTAVWLASAAEVEGVTGKYFDRRHERRSSNASYDEGAQEQLWKVSAGLTGLAESH